MSNVINIEQNLPHMTGEAVCIECKHEWVAVAPIGTHELECGECGTIKGVWKHMAAPATCWECKCGNQHFWIDPDGAMCAKCGTRQDF